MPASAPDHAPAPVQTLADLLRRLDSIATSLQADIRDDDQQAGSVDPSTEQALAEVLRGAQTLDAIADRAAVFSRIREHDLTLSVLRAVFRIDRSLLDVLAQGLRNDDESSRTTQHVALLTEHLGTGGAQAVAAEQARLLIEAGFRVTAVVRSDAPVAHELPDTVHLHVLAGSTASQLFDAWIDFCHENEPDLVIDHTVLYNRVWPFYALASQQTGAPTIGWLHSFALRPIAAGTRVSSFLTANLPLLRTVVVLSPTDVAYWKLRGLDNVVCIDNPPTEVLADLAAREPRTPSAHGPINLIWWGRLHDATKQVRDLLRCGAALRALGVDFTLTIIGPDTDDLTSAQLQQEAAAMGIADAVLTPGAASGEELIALIRQADVAVLTSVIEGYFFTLLEAQAAGLAVVMYDLPWLTPLTDNDGAIRVEQGDYRQLAAEVAALDRDRTRLRQVAASAREAALRSVGTDLGALYTQLITGTLPAQHSPAPTTSDAALLLRWIELYSERTAARNAQHRDQHASLERQHAALERDAEGLRASNDQLHTELEAQRSTAASLRRRLSDAEQQRRSLQQRFTAQHERTLELKHELERRKARNPLRQVARAVRRAVRSIRSRRSR